MAAQDRRVAIVTGGARGIGRACAHSLAERGYALVLVDVLASEMARTRSEIEQLGCPCLAYEADVAFHNRAHEVVDDVIGQWRRIDVLINNAGALFRRRQTTPDGFERTFALNHMAYFVLTDLLRDRLIKSAPARIVNVASEAHRGAMLDFDDLQSDHNYRGFAAYGRSKLCNILFTRELARRLQGTGVTANCLHPGFVASRFGDDNGGLFRIGIGIAKRLLAISPEDGAATSIYLASAPEVEGRTGLYFDKSKPATPSAAARDDTAAQELWLRSAGLAGIAG